MADDSSDDEIPLTKLTKPKGKAKPVVKEEDSDDEAFEEDAAPKRGGSSRKREKTSYKEESDEEEFDDDEEEDFEEEEEKPKKKAAKKVKTENGKAKAKAKAKPAAKAKAKSGGTKRKASSSNSSAAKKKVKAEPDKAMKELNRIQRFENAMKAYKWWEHDDLPDGQAWRSMEHNGLAFPPAYVPHGKKLLYDGEEVDLDPICEELATFYALVPDDGPQLGDPTTAKIFQDNFFKDFKKALGKDHVIKKFDKCDFSLLKAHIAEERMIKKAATDVEKAENKQIKEAMTFAHGFAIVDNHLERVGNIMIEPPSLFRGRGKHPLMGKVKERALPHQVTINVAEDVCIPKCIQPGHSWGSVQHDNSVTWLATWHENVLGKNKYVMLAAQSSFKGKSDRSKYEKAMRLKGAIGKIRADYKKNLNSKDLFNRQLATAMWVIDILALRVGGEKGEDEADTVGCCSLRAEHITMGEDNQGPHDLLLEFLGKDSMPYSQTIDFSTYGDIGIQVYNNFAMFLKKKKTDQQVFDKLDPPELNRHLQSIMPGLTAKVFRTYNASETLQNELPKAEEMDEKGLSVAEKVLAYNDANRTVAILCNHQKTVSNAQVEGLQILEDRLELFKKQKKELASMHKMIKDGKTKGFPLKDDSGKDAVEKAKLAIEKAKAQTQKATTAESKIAATQAMEAAKEKQREGRAANNNAMHLYARVPEADQVKKRIQQWADKISKLELDIKNKDDNKEVALGTSKINYCDPRISVAWCKRCEVPVEKVFPKTLRDKFVWAMPVPPDWEFEALQMGKKKK